MIGLSRADVGFNQTILNSINLAFHPGEIVFILGANGTGKSCLLQTLIRGRELLAGEIYGVAKNALERSLQISYAAQENIASAPITGQQYLDLICPRWCEDEIVQALNVSNLLGRSISKLSGGERQRLRLAAALLQKSQYYLLDEPTNSLDPKPSLDLSLLIKSLNRQGAAFIIVSHEINFALKTGQRFIGLKNSQVLFDDSLQNLREKQLLDQLFDRNFSWHQDQEGQWGVL